MRMRMHSLWPRRPAPRPPLMPLLAPPPRALLQCFPCPSAPPAAATLRMNTKNKNNNGMKTKRSSSHYFTHLIYAYIVVLVSIMRISLPLVIISRGVLPGARSAVSAHHVRRQLFREGRPEAVHLLGPEAAVSGQRGEGYSISIICAVPQPLRGARRRSPSCSTKSKIKVARLVLIRDSFESFLFFVSEVGGEWCVHA